MPGIYYLNILGFSNYKGCCNKSAILQGSIKHGIASVIAGLLA